MSKLKSPCVGICSTAIGDPVCRGCKRFNHEVVQWNGYTDSEKAIVLDRLQQLLDQVVGNYLSVTNTKLLNRHLAALNKRHRQNHNASANSKAFSALQAMAEPPIRDSKPELETLGLAVKPQYSQLSVKDLFQEIDEAYYRLCLAYYDANYIRAYHLRRNFYRQDTYRQDTEADRFQSMDFEITE